MVANGGEQKGLRRRRIVLGSMLLCSLGAFSAYHYLVFRIDRNEALEAIRPGRWHSFIPRANGPALTNEQREQIAQLEAIGYLSGSMPAPDAQGVLTYDEASAYNGLNLYCSGHGNAALLIDMEGNVLHTWQCDFRRVWSKRKGALFFPGQDYWRRVHLCENGDLLAIYGHGRGVVKVDKDSKVLWLSPRGYHHDLEVLDDGTIYLLSRRASMIPRISEDFPVLEDFVSILDSEGAELRRISLLEAFEKSDYTTILAHMRDREDIFHTNTVEYLDGSLADVSPLFRKGNLLVCVRVLDAIAIVDPETERVVWAMVGPWDAQHQPTLLANGHMLIFDNAGSGYSRSRVIEFEPLTGKNVWSYGEGASETFYSASCGSCQRLPNGNTLITESDNGRAFEVTLDKRIVWEFVNPHRAGENNELIATLFEIVRLEPDFPLDWLGRADSVVASPRTQ